MGDSIDLSAESADSGENSMDESTESITLSDADEEEREELIREAKRKQTKYGELLSDEEDEED